MSSEMACSARAITESSSVSGERRSSLSSKCCATPSSAGSEAGTSAGTSSRPRNCGARTARSPQQQAAGAQADGRGGSVGACTPCVDPARRGPRRAGSAAGVPAASLSTERTRDQQIGGGSQVRMAVIVTDAVVRRKERDHEGNAEVRHLQNGRRGLRVRARVSSG